MNTYKTAATRPWTERRLVVNGLDTYFLEAGDREAPVVVLLAYSGPGATAEEAFEFNIPALAQHFRVIAPDVLGCGKTAKVVSLTDSVGLRVRHIARLLEMLAIERANFVGVSTTGSVVLRVAAEPEPRWPIDRVIGVSAVGRRAGPQEFPEAMRAFYSSHSPQDMDRILEFIFPTHWWDSEYTARRVRWALEPGVWEGWEIDAAALHGASNRDRAPSALANDDDVAFEQISRPVLLIGGGSDQLRPPNITAGYAKRIPNCEYKVYPDAGHFPHVDRVEEFNQRAIDFLSRP